MGRGVGVAAVAWLATTNNVGVVLGRAVGLADAVDVGEGVTVALGEGDGVVVAVAGGEGGTTDGVAGSVAVADRVSLAAMVGVPCSSEAEAVAVATSTAGATRSPAGASSTNRNVGPPMMQPSVSSAQRAAGNVSA